MDLFWVERFWEAFFWVDKKEPTPEFSILILCQTVA